MMRERPLLVGISGGSAAGKTTFTTALAEGLADFAPIVVNQDHYFRNWEDVPPEKREAERTSNHPRAVLWEALVDHVRRLQKGETVEMPIVGTRAHSRGDVTRTITPGGIVFVEGHLIFSHEVLRSLFDVTLFLDVDTHERVLRRMVRDTKKSNMTLDGAVAWYRRDVIPNFGVHTAPTQRFADVIMPFEGETARGLTVLIHGLRVMLVERGIAPIQVEK